jgi:DNA-binding NtrC family response regulator
LTPDVVREPGSAIPYPGEHMEEKILFVDDDENLLASMRRSLQKYFNVETAVGAEAGIAIIKDAFAVVVSDFRMPGMDGVQFLDRKSTRLNSSHT